MSKKLFVSFIVSILSIASVQPMTRFARTPGEKLLQISSLLPHLSQKDINTVASGGVKGSPVRHMTYQEAYNVLGLQPGSSDKEIAAKHRELFMKHHPDKGGSLEQIEKINQARDVLKKLVDQTATGISSYIGSSNQKTKIYDEFISAIKSNNVEEVKRLLTQGVDVNAQDEYGYNPLFYAVVNGNTEMVKLLIEAGADVNTKNKFGTTPLFSVALLGRTEVAKLLIEAGADVNTKNVNGETPLFTAAHNGNTEIAKLLIDAGADVNTKNLDGKTPLFYARFKGDTQMAKLLLEASKRVVE